MKRTLSQPDDSFLDTFVEKNRKETGAVIEILKGGGLVAPKLKVLLIGG